MSLFPCKKCSCGVYHGFDVKICDKCNADIGNVTITVVETDEIPTDKRGIIASEQTVYTYKCRRCGSEYFNTESKVTQKRCDHCGNIKFTDPEQLKAKAEPEPESEDTQCEKADKVTFEGDARTDFGGVLDNIKNTVGQDEVIEWPDFGEPVSSHDPSITLTSIRYGTHSFKVDPGEGEYMLGKLANQGEFLSQDPRVSREHCILYFKDGAWYVKDNNSANGVAVNGVDIGEGGVAKLINGTLLKLGHHANSMEFSVAIG